MPGGLRHRDKDQFRCQAVVCTRGLLRDVAGYLRRDGQTTLRVARIRAAVVVRRTGVGGARSDVDDAVLGAARLHVQHPAHRVRRSRLLGHGRRGGHGHAHRGRRRRRLREFGKGSTL
mgnify:CR=1 FL=1